MEILLIPVGVYVLLVAYAFVSQSRMIYHPSKTLAVHPDDVGLDYESISLVTSDGVSLSGWFVPAEPSNGVLLFCHGNAGNISDRLTSIQIFHELGLSVLIFDYRGYGHSEGRPTEAGTYRDAQAAWDYLVKTRQVPPDQIVLFGRSLGGAVAAHLAKDNRPRGLILESTFTSGPDVGAHYFPYLPVRLLLRFRYNTARYIREVRCPVLVVHSPDDDIVPFRFGRGLYEAAPEPKTFLEITGSHNEGFVNSGRLYTEGLADFLDSAPPGSDR